MENSDLSGVNESTVEITSSESSRFIAHEIIFFIFAIVGICADAAIIYTILRFKRMRTIPNMFLVNWVIADLFYLIVTPSSYRILSVIDHMTLTHEFLCVLFEAGVNLHVTVIVFVILVTVDWLMAAYFHRISEKFRKHYKYVIGSTWISVILFCSLTIGLCLNKMHIYFLELLLLCTYGTILLIVVVLQCTRAVQKYRKKPLDYPTQTLTLASAFVLSYLLALINIIITHATKYHPLIAILSACLIFSSSIVNFTLLFFFNKDFQACFRQAIKRTGQNYEESIEGVDNTTDNASDKYSVQVSFHNPTEELLTNAY